MGQTGLQTVQQAKLETLEDYLQVYFSLKEAGEETVWQQAAMLAAMKNKFGLSVKKIASMVRCSESQVRVLIKTWSAFPVETKRAQDLSYYHHRLAADTTEPEEWLEKAIENNWSTEQLRKEIKLAKGGYSPETIEQENLKKAERVVKLLKEVLSSSGASALWLRQQVVEILQEQSATKVVDG